jgi:hypothetical protein
MARIPADLIRHIRNVVIPEFDAAMLAALEAQPRADAWFKKAIKSFQALFRFAARNDIVGAVRAGAKARRCVDEAVAILSRDPELMAVIEPAALWTHLSDAAYCIVYRAAFGSDPPEDESSVLWLKRVYKGQRWNVHWRDGKPQFDLIDADRAERKLAAKYQEWLIREMRGEPDAQPGPKKGSGRLANVSAKEIIAYYWWRAGKDQERPSWEKLANHWLVSPDTLKRRVGDLEIKRWPPRKLKNLDELAEHYGFS